MSEALGSGEAMRTGENLKCDDDDAVPSDASVADALPWECVVSILQNLAKVGGDHVDLCNAGMVCVTWRDAARAPDAWVELLRTRYQISVGSSAATLSKPFVEEEEDEEDMLEMGAVLKMTQHPAAMMVKRQKLRTRHAEVGGLGAETFRVLSHARDDSLSGQEVQCVFTRTFVLEVGSLCPSQFLQSPSLPHFHTQSLASSSAQKTHQQSNRTAP